MRAFTDLRDYIGALTAELGPDEVRTIRGAHWDLEIGCLTELLAEAEGPALLFDEIPGHQPGFRVFANFMGTPARSAVALGLPPATHPVDIVRAWKGMSRELKPIPPTEVDTGPILQNVLEGDAVDLGIFPAPRWHQDDGGRYIGTADMVVVRDPDTGWVNAATYRCCVQGRDRLSVWMLGTAHGRVIAEKYWKRGQSCPIAVVVGQDPILSTAAAMPVPAGSSEYDLAGGLRGEPVRLVRLPGSGLVVPAGAEIVIEGELPPVTEESVLEGPFGEWTGYYTHSGQETVIRVKRILHRDDPIILGAPPMIPTVPAGDQAVPLYAASVTWEQLENSGVGNVRAVWAYARQLMMVISIEQRAPGDPMRALLAAAGRKRAGGMERFFVVVDPDIDVSNLNEVLWAILTRADPATSIQTLRTATSVLDPRLPPQRRADGDHSMGIMLIDACKPFAWRDQFPTSNRFAEDYRAQVRQRWHSVLAG